MPRRKKPRARGQIRSRGLDKWLVRVYIGQDPKTGKRKYASKTVTGSKRAAERKLTEMLHEVDQDSYVEPSKLTLSDFLEKWLEQKTDVSKGTHRGYARRVRLDVDPYLGHMKLESIHQTHISKLYNTTLYKERKLSGRTIQYTHTILRQAFDQAVAWGILRKNPTDSVTVPTRDKRKVRTLSPAQVQTLLGRTAGTPWGALWTLLLTTGCRPQEALALKWSDLSEDDGCMTIRRTMKRDGNHWEPSDSGKTKKSMRRVRLPSGTLEVLRKHRLSQVEWALKLGAKYNRQADWVFPKEDGNFRQYKQVWNKWKETLKKLELPEDIRLYDTRHTHATTLLLRGVPVKVVSERLGHANISMTLDTYTEVLPEMQEEAANQIDQAFFGPQAVNG